MKFELLYYFRIRGLISEVVAPKKNNDLSSKCDGSLICSNIPLTHIHAIGSANTPVQQTYLPFSSVYLPPSRGVTVQGGTKLLRLKIQA